MLLAATAPHEDRDTHDEDRYGRQKSRERLDVAFNAPYLRLHVLTAALDLCVLFRVDIDFHGFETPILDFLEVARHDLLGLRVEVGTPLHFGDLLIESLLRLAHRRLGLQLGLLLVFRALREELARTIFDRFERTMTNPSLAQPDKGLVIDQNVYAVEKKGYVVELQILDTAPANLKKLLGDKVEVRNHDEVDARRVVGCLGSRYPSPPEVDDFPLTVTGKVQKFRMREMAMEALGLGDVTTVTYDDQVPEEGAELAGVPS